MIRRVFAARRPSGAFLRHSARISMRAPGRVAVDETQIVRVQARSRSVSDRTARAGSNSGPKD